MVLGPGCPLTGGSESTSQIVSRLSCATVSRQGTPGTRYHPYRPMLCWYRVNPIPEHTAAMIQNRSMILVSDQAIISK